MSSRKTTFFYAALIAVVSLAIGMVIASRLDMAPRSEAQALSAPPPMNSAPLSGPVDAGTFRGIAHDQSPMVVSISTTSTRTSEATDDQSDELFRRFFGTPRQQPEEPQESTGAGTGFIIDNSAGLILTNNHVVEHANKIRVQLYGEEGEEEDGHEARVVGRDPLTDSALIELVEKTAAAKMPQARFGDSGQMQPGDWVVAIGNPFRYNHTVTVGVISGLSRPFDVAPQRRVNMLQTDAAINPGNSGGPLLNVRGEVIGINTAILSNRMANIGIGFAVPINLVRELLPQLRTGKVTRGKIGVTIQATRITQEDAENWGLPDRKGAVVREVERGGPAAKAGLRPGDVVVEYNGRKVDNDKNLVEMVVVTKPGTSVPVKVFREKGLKTLSLTVAELTIGPAEAPDVTAASDLTSSFGLQLEDLTPTLAKRLQLPGDAAGAVVSGLKPRGPAGRAGLSENDVIVKVGSKDVASAEDAAAELERVQPGRSVGVHVLRARGSEMFATIRREP
ncbi:MAG: trypsin-like peptidase domain-containing protein [Vicinamibacteraceae bacterium]